MLLSPIILISCVQRMGVGYLLQLVCYRHQVLFRWWWCASPDDFLCGEACRENNAQIIYISLRGSAEETDGVWPLGKGFKEVMGTNTGELKKERYTPGQERLDSGHLSCFGLFTVAQPRVVGRHTQRHTYHSHYYPISSLSPLSASV